MSPACRLAVLPGRTLSILVIWAMIVPSLSDLGNHSNSIGQQHLSEMIDPIMPSPPTGCRSCKMREEIRTLNLRVIKEQILQRLGLAAAPNVSGRALPPVPQHFLEKLDLDSAGMQNDQAPLGEVVVNEDDNYHVKTQEILIFAQPHAKLRHKRGHDILHFNFTESITKYHVSNATLFIFVEGADRRPLPDVLIQIFKVYKAPNHSEAAGLYRIISKKVTQPFGKGDWIKFDLTVTVSEWFKDPNENHGFVVNGTANGKKVVVTDTSWEDGSKVPHVEVSTTEGRRRVRRNVALNCDDKMIEPLCCRYPLIVDFDEFGWDFIIAPKRYNAHYCSGDCPYVTMQKYPHTHLTKMALPTSAHPCCVPRKMSSISMLYFDLDLVVVYGSLPGMVVDRCGCS